MKNDALETCVADENTKHEGDQNYEKELVREAIPVTSVKWSVIDRKKLKLTANKNFHSANPSFEKISAKMGLTTTNTPFEPTPSPTPPPKKKTGEEEKIGKKPISRRRLENKIRRDVSGFFPSHDGLSYVFVWNKA